MGQKILGVLAISSALLIAPLGASAATTFTLDTEGCSFGCSVSPFGTVVLSPTNTDTVHVAIQLAPDYSFRKSNDSNHHSFAFNLSTGAATISNIVSGDTESQTFSADGPGSFTMVPFGSFAYILDCTTCVPGAPVAPTHQLSFDVVATGLTIASFVPTGLYYFAADVGGITEAAGVGLSGNVTTLNGVSNPEPVTSALAAAGLGAMFLLRRKGR
jgi:hypothetical protein